MKPWSFRSHKTNNVTPFRRDAFFWCHEAVRSRSFGGSEPSMRCCRGYREECEILSRDEDVDPGRGEVVKVAIRVFGKSETKAGLGWLDLKKSVQCLRLPPTIMYRS